MQNAHQFPGISDVKTQELPYTWKVFKPAAYLQSMSRLIA